VSEGAVEEGCDVGEEGGLEGEAIAAGGVLRGREVGAHHLGWEGAHDREVTGSGEDLVVDQGGIGDAAVDGFGVGGRRDRVLFAAAEEDGDTNLAQVVGREPEGCRGEQDEGA